MLDGLTYCTYYYLGLCISEVAWQCQDSGTFGTWGSRRINLMVMALHIGSAMLGNQSILDILKQCVYCYLGAGHF